MRASWGMDYNDKKFHLGGEMPFLADYAWSETVLLAKTPKNPRKNRGTCDAKTRQGGSCQAPPVWDKISDKALNGRCKLHGGKSTGPRTEVGREAIRESNRRRKAKLEMASDT